MLFDGMTWVCGIWFCGDGSSVDWLCAVGKGADDKWRMNYRFRYYKDDKVHDSDDEKSWYSFGAPDSSEASKKKMMETTNEVARATALRFRSPYEFVPLECPPGDPKIFFELGSREWANIKVEKE